MQLKERTQPDSNLDRFSTYFSYDELDLVEQEIERQEIIARYQTRDS